MRRLILLTSFLLLFCLAAVAAGDNATDHFLKGRSLLQEKNFTAALEEFQKANELKPDLPEVSWGMGACLNALGKFPEAKAKLESAFHILENRPRTVDSNWGPIDVGYYALLADIHVNLNEPEAAVETIGKFSVPDKGLGRVQALETLKTVKKDLSTKLVANGARCLGSNDLDGARLSFAQAEKLQPMTTESLQTIARGALAQADRVAAITDEDKAKKTELYRMAIEYLRRLPATESGSPEVKRMLGRALSGTRDSKDYQEAVRVLTALSEAPAGQPAPDPTILLDLATAYLNGEDWDAAVKTASKFIQIAPESARGQGYCKRSFAYYKQGQFKSSIEDGSKCTNADGTPRQLKHIELCRRELDKQKEVAAVAAAQKAALQDECTQLNRELRWVKVNPNPEVTALVPIIAHLESARAKCKGLVEEMETSELCRTGIYMASNPANLASATAEELKDLETSTTKYLKLCDAHLNDRQKADVRDALKRISGNP